MTRGSMEAEFLPKGGTTQDDTQEDVADDPEVPCSTEVRRSYLSVAETGGRGVRPKVAPKSGDGNGTSAFRGQYGPGGLGVGAARTAKSPVRPKEQRRATPQVLAPLTSSTVTNSAANSKLDGDSVAAVISDTLAKDTDDDHREPPRTARDSDANSVTAPLPESHSRANSLRGLPDFPASASDSVEGQSSSCGPTPVDVLVDNRASPENESSANPPPRKRNKRQRAQRKAEERRRIMVARLRCGNRRQQDFIRNMEVSFSLQRGWAQAPGWLCRGFGA